ncbi:MAG: type I restriction enzyme HsdR N-terminal domain-containing protein [Bacteroidia bacterium]
MQQLNFPVYQFKIKEENKRTQIFDTVRKKYVALTPEEWVRQHIITFLISEKKFPASLIAVEVSLNRGSKKQRGDIVVYTNNGKPRMIIECKAPEVKITQDVFFQIARYNAPLKMNYLVVTNGIRHFCCKMNYESGDHVFIKEIPDYDSLI